MDNLELIIVCITFIVPTIGAFYYVKFNDKRQDDSLKQITDRLDIICKLFDSLSNRVNKISFEHERNTERILKHNSLIENCKDIHHQMATKDDSISVEKFDLKMEHLELLINQNFNQKN